MYQKKALVAMSGGVDSAVAALLLKEQGYDTAGITMMLWSDNAQIVDNDLPSDLDQNCIDAKNTAKILGIPHHSVAYGDTFKRNVIDSFIKEYALGLTPNPCVFCNKHIKFGVLLDKALSLGYPYLATGHYARIERDISGRYLLKKAVDESKDQSYFLWSLSKDILPHIIFPLGKYTKPTIRAMAEQHKFSSAHRSDSQDICFISDGDYVSFISNNSSVKITPGNFIDINNNVLGKHNGMINYTIGQRKGLGIAFGRPMFVGAKNAVTNTVTLCEDSELYRTTLTARSINLIACDSITSPIRLKAKIRYRHTEAEATVEQISNDRLFVQFDMPQRAVASGQSLVLYDGDTVVGGGIIE